MSHAPALANNCSCLVFGELTRHVITIPIRGAAVCLPSEKKACIRYENQSQPMLTRKKINNLCIKKSGYHK